MKTNVIVLYGGKSVEHEISLKTALTVIQSLDPSTFTVYPIYINHEGIWCSLGELASAEIDMQDIIIEPATLSIAKSMGQALLHPFSLEGRKVVLPLLHGSNGEDGTVQGLLELLDIPYVGNGVLSSAAALDKAVFKKLIESTGIAQADYVAFQNRQWQEDRAAVIQAIEERIDYPCYVKPSSLGSSIGISRCENKEQLLPGIEEAFRYDAKIVVEKEVVGREIQVAVMGNEQPIASLPGEFIHSQAFFDFESKYMDQQLKMSIPATIDKSLSKQLRQAALLAYETVGCSGLARVDFFIQENGRFFLNEINTLPGFTSSSMYPVMWERTDGTSYSELIEKLIDYAFTKHAERQSIQFRR